MWLPGKIFRLPTSLSFLFAHDHSAATRLNTQPHGFYVLFSTDKVTQWGDLPLQTSLGVSRSQRSRCHNIKVSISPERILER